MRYTFQYQWPAPLKRGWKLSGKRFDTLHDAALAMADWLETCFENDCQMEGRLITVDD